MEERERGLLPTGGIDRLTYDPERFPFAEVILAAIGAEGLRENPTLAPEPGPGDHHQALQGTLWHQLFYRRFEVEIQPLYVRFLLWLRDSHGFKPGGLVYQKVPTFRVHSPGGKAVGEQHRDRAFGHAGGEVNFWLPLVDASASNTVWIMVAGVNTEGNCRYGQVLVFDGVNLLHGNVLNRTGKTRVSIDFRLADAATFQPSGKQSVSAGRRFEIGDYFGVI